MSSVRINFVHTPMAVIQVDEREAFWRNFDRQYHAAHPNLRPMRRPLWELPHWMHWLGGVLTAHGYTDIGAIDFYTSETTLRGIDREQVAPVIRDNPADVYLFSPMTPNLFYALEIAEVIKQIHPKALTLFGGVMATPKHAYVASHPAVDYVVTDRGEYALPALLGALFGSDDLADVGNLTHRLPGGDIRVAPKTYDYMPVNDIPFPLVELFEPEVGQDLRYLRAVHGLGCPFRCAFCTIQTIGRKADYFATDRVISEIRAYQGRYGEHHGIYFGDETFTVSKPKTLEICAALEREGDIVFDCQTRLNCLNDPEVIDALARAGCTWIEIGIETTNADTQDRYKQKSQMHRIEDVLKRLRDAGISTCSFMTVGLPNETPDVMRRSLDTIAGLISRDLMQASYISSLVPYPGSDFYERPETHGMTIRHENFNLYHEDMAPVFDSAFGTSDEVYKAFLHGVATLAEAMDKRPYFDTAAPIGSFEYGSFWNDAHV